MTTREEDSWDKEESYPDEWHFDSYTSYEQRYDALYDAWAEEQYKEPELRKDWVGQCELCKRFYAIDSSRWVLSGKVMDQVCKCSNDPAITVVGTIREVTDPVVRDAKLAALLVGGEDALNSEQDAWIDG